MNIIIEGPDGGGKSTLARTLVLYFPGFTLVPGGGPPQSPTEIIERTRAYLARTDRSIFDRHPVVSQPIYGALRDDPIDLAEFREPFYMQNNLYIYCHVNRLEGHILKSYDTHEHLKLITDQFHRLVLEYDLWAAARAHIIYRKNDAVKPIASYIKTFFAKH